MAFDPVLTSFLLLLLSEVADKTMLLILGLALQFRSKFSVFLGALSAHALMDLVAIVIGSFVGITLPETVLKPVIAVVFIGLGLWQLYKLYLRKSAPKHRDVPEARNAFLASFLLVAFSEFGDKSQVISGLLGARFTDIAQVFFGVLLGLILAIGLNVFVAANIAERMPRKAVKTIAAVLFIAFGVLAFFV